MADDERLVRAAVALCREMGCDYWQIPERATYLQRKTGVDRAILDRAEAKGVAKEILDAALYG